MQPQDVVKMCYQAAHGAEHLLSDIDSAERYFYEEFRLAEPREEPLYEQISPEVCRINLAEWKASGMPPEWLFYIFSHTAVFLRMGEPILLDYLETASKLLRSKEFDAFAAEYKRKEMHALHHSEEYRAAERPHYRIVNSYFIPVLPILKAATSLRSEVKVIAIDGRAAAGKTTAAGILCDILGAGLVHTDDFFLPSDMRTEERISTPGGNVHYERFAKEVLPFLSSADAFSYRRFNCSKMELDGVREVAASHWRIVEGAYCHHPFFGDYADLRVFMDISPEHQMQRIIARDGETMANMFAKRWIPLEESYHAHCNTKGKADIIIE